MTTPINLNKARKARARTEKLAAASQNRAKFGQTKAEKQAELARKASNDATLDRKKRDT